MSMNFGIAEYWYDLYDFLLENTLQLHKLSASDASVSTFDYEEIYTSLTKSNKTQNIGLRK